MEESICNLLEIASTEKSLQFKVNTNANTNANTNTRGTNMPLLKNTI